MAYKKFKIDKGDHFHWAVECEAYYIGDRLMTHKSIQKPCAYCEAMNDAFMDLVRVRGAHAVEEKMSKQLQYKKYAQRWPYDMRKNILSSEVVFDGKDVWVEGDESRTELERIMDEEAADELIRVLTDDEKFVVTKISEGYMPKDIAVLREETSSDRVRQIKYSALRKLGVPIQSQMRRVP